MKNKKEEITIIGYFGHQSNPYYDPNFVCNGGGYFQYYGNVDFMTTDGIFHVEYEDTSCGDFGNRNWYSITAPDGEKYIFMYNEMDDQGDEPVVHEVNKRNIDEKYLIDIDKMLTDAIGIIYGCAYDEEASKRLL